MKLNITEIDVEKFISFLEPVGTIYKAWIDKELYPVDEESVKEALGLCASSKVTVVATDLMKYSQKTLLQQVTIPDILTQLHNFTLDCLKKNEAFLFSGFEDVDVPRIDTGDGSFLFFSTPLHGLLYIIWFNVWVGFYNTFHITPKLRKLLGNLKIRFSMTYDELYKYKGNYYGPAIINASRIISKDRLDRLLIDENVMEWFSQYINGIENLQMISEFELIKLFKEAFAFEAEKTEANVQSIFRLEKFKHWGIKACDVQEIGEVVLKDRNLNVYSLHLQILAGLIKKRENGEEPGKGEENIKITSTIGNLNPLGLL